MKFTKMHGCGNDYVYVNCFEETVEDRPALARLVSDRHFGVGGDGLICICPSEKADFKMDMYNADGSVGQMCGNGIRCVAKYVYERGMTKKSVIDVETGAGVKTLWMNTENGIVESVRVCMGSPEFKAKNVPVLTESEVFINQPLEVGGMQWSVTAVSVGNPRGLAGPANDRSAVRESPPVPGKDKYRVRPGRGPTHAEDARLGARQR